MIKQAKRAELGKTKSYRICDFQIECNCNPFFLIFAYLLIIGRNKKKIPDTKQLNAYIITINLLIPREGPAGKTIR